MILFRLEAARRAETQGAGRAANLRSGLDDDCRIFPVSKHYLHHEMDRGSKKAGVKRIRIHDLRHSCCALLIHLGYAPVQIAERLGHESAVITQRYAHLYPSVQKDMANRLDQEFNDTEGD